MGILATNADERVRDVRFDADSLIVDLMDGRTISVPLAWYPRLKRASVAQRRKWEISGGGYGIHWPEIDEDLSTEGLLRGAPAPRGRQASEVAEPTLPAREAGKPVGRSLQGMEIALGASASKAKTRIVMKGAKQPPKESAKNSRDKGPGSPRQAAKRAKR